MEKKRILDLFLISFLFMVGVYLVSSTVAFNSIGSAVNISGNEQNRSASNGYVNGSVWTKGGTTEIINFTINFTGPDSISAVNITIPIEAYRLMNRDVRNVTISMNDKTGLANGAGIETVNWTITNTTSVVILRTVQGNYSTNGTDTLQIPLNIEFNVTANNSLEGAYTWNVSFTDNGTATTDIESTTFVTYIDGLRPRITEINVTDDTTVLKASSEELNNTKWLKNTSITIYATATELNVDEGALPRILYTVDGTGANTSSTAIVMSVPSGSANGSLLHRLNATIPVSVLRGNGSYALSFIIQANDTYNNMYVYNTSAQGGFNFSIDGANPTSAITPPTLTTISTSDSIKYTCTGTDADSGVNSYLWTITKPNGQAITKTTSAITLTGADTAGAGTYNLNCKVTDIVGYETTSATYQFTAHITSTGGDSGSSGGSSGGTGASTAEVKVDKSITEIGASATITKSEGQSSTFSLDGKVSHTLKFKTVTSGSATIVIQSDPIEVTLNVGETKEVDVDGDGTNDLEVTLESVSSGAAKVTLKKIAETTAETAAAEPTTPTGEETTATPTEPETSEGKTSLVWLWVVIVVIIVIAIVVAFQNKKKK